MALEPELVAMFGISLTIVVLALGYALDYLGRKVVWSPIMCFLDVPIALGTGIVCLGYPVWGIFWWIGLVYVLLAVLLSFGGLWSALGFGRKLD